MHICPNGKKYIGITKQEPKKRWLNGKGYKTNNYFYKAINKYNWANIEHKILFKELTKEEAEIKEKELIKKYKSNIREFGYNIENGGHVNCVSNETKEKISKTMKEKQIYKNNPNCFKKGHKPWTTGLKLSKEHKKILSVSHKGKKLNSIQKEKILKILKQNHLKRRKPIIQYDKNNNFIKEWESAQQIEKELNISHTHVGQCCKGKRKTSGGFIWKYKLIEGRN
jgi:group I intron endonuclease